MKHISLIFSTTTLLLGGLLNPAVALIPVPEPGAHVINLDGKWQFKLEQAPPPPHVLGASGRPIPILTPTNLEPFYLLTYREGSDWHPLKVPSNWEMAGYSPATYNQPDNASGMYRLRFEVPAKWEGRRVLINFDGVQNGCEVWCNGQPVEVDRSSAGRTNYHESGWTAWQADLTPVVKFGQANLLALHVTKNTKTVDCDTGDFFFLGGVHRPVTLFSVPQAHVSDLSIRTSVGKDEAEVTVLAEISPATAGAKVSVQLGDLPNAEGTSDADGHVKLTLTVPHPRLWSAEFPNLYPFALEMKTPDGKDSERVIRRVGLREVSIENGIFCVNHVPVKLVGICRHDVSPDLGTAVNADLWKKDLTLMKQANFNAVRTSHYTYGSGFYDLCDQMGFYVLDEEPFCWVNCDDPELLAGFEQRSREAVMRDKNHACVVMWGIGNENHPGRDNARAAAITRELDPTRPRLISCQKADEGTEPVEFDDAHYITPQQIHRAETDAKRRAKWPMIYTENPNVWEERNGPDYGSLDMWAPVIVRTWNELWQDDHVCGNFLWEWQDRAVADKNPTKYYYFFPETGISLLKVKGVVDGFRNPRPEFFHIKMAQSPIVLGSECEVEPGGFAVIALTNRYSFTDLKELSVKWTLRRGAKHWDGYSQCALAPRSQGQLRLSLPEARLAEADTLEVAFDHPSGWNVITCQYPLKPVSHAAPKVQTDVSLRFPQFNFVTGVVTNDGKGWRKLDRFVGELTDLKVTRHGQAEQSSSPEALYALPLTEVTSLEAEVVLKPGGKSVGHLHADYAGGKLNYHLAWTGKPKTDVYEFGWRFAAPKGADRFSWDRAALWSWYPETHIGRPRGTARPESARAQLTKVSKPDAFDFDSTKFNCNWASLADRHGHGIGVRFSPDQRQHVRGEIEQDGSYALVVNRSYSPPRDISSPIVPDLYTTLGKNGELSGSFQLIGMQ